MKIAVDAMGGDHAPSVVVEGACLAAREYGVDIILVGPENRVRDELKKIKNPPASVSIRHASEVIGMDEPATVSIRKKRDSSITVGIKLLRENEAQAFFSAGNTGAVVCAATLTLGLLPGIERPGIALVVPTLKNVALLIDVGANIDAKPLHLLQYAVMACSYFEFVLQYKNPKVGILNIGEEQTKGTEFIKDTYALIEKSKLNFVGNVEAKDIFSGKVDVIVCDGFVGNVALKVAESVSETIGEFLKRELLKSFMNKIATLILRRSLRKFKKDLDYSEYGGAPLLGIDGVVIIGHGRSSSKAIKNAIRVAKAEVEMGVNANIIESIKSIGA